MGQVFAFEKIAGGRVPKLASFKYVADAARSTFLPEPSIVAAVLFGSVVRGDYNLRSDVDCLVIYDTEKEKAAKEVIHEVGRVARGLHVPVNFAVCDTRLVETRLHHFGTSFIRHVGASIKTDGTTNGHIKGALDDLITPTTRVAEEIEWYIRTEMDFLQGAYAGMDSFSLTFLKKMLEAPMHVARAVLVYENKLTGDSKKQVQDRYAEVMPKHLAKQFGYLLELDAYYGMELGCQLQKLEEKAYALTLSNLEKEVPNVLEFVRSNIVYLDRAR